MLPDVVVNLVILLISGDEGEIEAFVGRRNDVCGSVSVFGFQT